MKYVVLHQFSDDDNPTAYVLEVDRPSQVRQAFFEKFLGLIDGKVRRGATRSDLTMKFWLEQDEYFTFCHVDEEYQIEGLVEEGQALSEKLAEENRENEEAIQKEYRYKQYLRLKKEFEETEDAE